MESPFSTAATAERVVCDENIGRLLLITPLEVQKGIPTVNGEADALHANVVVLDETGAGAHAAYYGALIFSRVLIGSLKGSIGKEMPVLGVLGKGEAKQGKSAPWIIKSDVTDAQITIAMEYWEAHRPPPRATVENPFS